MGNTYILKVDFFSEDIADLSVCHKCILTTRFTLAFYLKTKIIFNPNVGITYTS